MTGNALLDFVALPVAFGLVGFIEPCSIGSTLIFIKTVEGRPAAGKLVQMSLFAAFRAAFIGLLGVAAVMVGAAFFAFQKAAWTEESAGSCAPSARGSPCPPRRRARLALPIFKEAP